MAEESYLQLIPIQRCEFVLKNEIVTVLFDKKQTWIDKLFFKKLSTRKVKIDLDEIGSFLWQLIDGKIPVGNLVAKGKEKFGEKIEPAEIRVTEFIKQLHRTQLIDLYEKS